MNNEPKRLGIVRIDLGNLGEEIWLVSNANEVQDTYDSACEMSPPPEQCPLDQAAAATDNTECYVLAAHWGVTFPAERSQSWLTDVLGRCDEPEIVRDIVETYWSED